MSRIGNAPVTIPEKVEVRLEGDIVHAKGPKGEHSVTIEPHFVSVKIEEGVLTVTRLAETKEARARHGLYRSLLNNLVWGVQEGFSKTLEIRGVGYRVAQKGKILEMNLGYSHPVQFEVPEGLEVTFHEKNQNIFTLSGVDKQLVGHTAAEIRKCRPPEPYKGKGVRYIDEHVVQKAGKSAKKATA